MHKLTPIFIAGALAISAGLAMVQSQISKPAPMAGHEMPAASQPAAGTAPHNGHTVAGGV